MKQEVRYTVSNMKQVHIKAAISKGWSHFIRRPWYLLGLTFAALWLFFVSMGNGAIATALSYIVYGGYVALLLRHAAGEHIVFDDLFDVVDRRWISFAFLGIIKGFLILLGFACFIIPGIYLTVRWMFAEVLVIDKGLRPLEALKASSALTAGVRGKLFWLLLILALIVLLSTFALIIGAVVAAIVAQFTVLTVYRDLQAVGVADAPHEEEHHE